MKKIYNEKPCMDCGKIVRMHIKSKRCKECQEEENRRNDAAHRRAKARGHTRELGSNDFCTACGKPYIIKSGMQKYCPSCAPAATKAADSQATLAWIQAAYEANPARRDERNAKRRSNWSVQLRRCVVCDVQFLPPNPRRKTCSAECQTEYHRQQQRESDKKRNKVRYQEHKAEFDALSAEDRRAKQDEINRKARENYAKRKNKEENT